MNLGTIITKTEPETGQAVLYGEIVTYSLDLRFKLLPITNRQSEKSPTHSIVGQGKHGKPFQAGVCFEGRTNDGKPMFKLYMEIPELGLVNAEYVAWEAVNGEFDIRNSQPKKEAA